MSAANDRARRQALRRVKTSEATPRTPHVLRFLAEHSGNLYHLVGEVTAPWEHSGQRVLFLEEAADYWRWTMSGVRRSRSRRKKETEPAAPAGADHQHAVGLAGRPPVPRCAASACGGLPPLVGERPRLVRTDRSPLAAVVAGALDAYGVVILLSKSG
ncbi:hypothetical protein [Streptomyces sp. HO565]|uniref:hypothetical protein n=1 Tax=Streptomyces sp. HO565 TaxID=2857489 RepID=UPI0034DC3B48